MIFVIGFLIRCAAQTEAQLAKYSKTFYEMMQTFCSLVSRKFFRDAFAPSLKAIYEFLRNTRGRITAAIAKLEPILHLFVAPCSFNK